MIIVLRPTASGDEIERIVGLLHSEGYESQLMHSFGERIICCDSVSGAPPADVIGKLKASRFVARVFSQRTRYPRVSRESKTTRTVVTAGPMTIGDQALTLIAGPCTVCDSETLFQTAEFVKSCGATGFRGGAYKPTTSPYSFQGLGLAGLKLLAEVKSATGLGIVTELLAIENIEAVAAVADLIQIGARNMQNFELLRAAAKTHKPILLKRGQGATIEEWLLAAEYIADAGNEQIVLCERGIKTFEPLTRATLDVGAIALANQLSHLPVIADPSHSAGNRSIVPQLGVAAVAAGACGLLVEVHPNPDTAIKDGAQTIGHEQFRSLAKAAKKVRDEGMVAEVGLEPTTPRV